MAKKGANKPKTFRRTALDTYPISTRVTMQMIKAIDNILESGKYLRVADYLRDLIRKDLEVRGIILE